MEINIEEVYWYWLCNVRGIGRKKIANLIEEFGGPKKVYEANSEMLEKVNGIGQKEVKSFIESKATWDIAKEYEKLKDKEVKFLSIWHKEYPSKLKYIEDYPFGIYVKGQLPNEKVPSVAVVGARMCSEYGRIVAKEIARVLSQHKVQIISGLAMGIDGISQQAAIYAGGKTFGVLGCGVDICYPRENIELYMEIQKQGGLISEFNIGTKPAPFHFPMRNRIISALADIIIVIEAKEKSGSLITADMALEQGKDVLAVPGRINDSLSYGCNNLIKQGAGLILSPEDVLRELDLEDSKSEKNYKKNQIRLESLEKVLYSCLDFQPKSLQVILTETGIALDEVMAGLLTLELKGCIAEIGKHQYIKS